MEKNIESDNSIIVDSERKALIDYCSKLEDSIAMYLESDISVELEASKKGRNIIYDKETIDYFNDIILKISSLILKYSIKNKELGTLYKITPLGKYTITDNQNINTILTVIKSLAKKETFQDGKSGDILYIKPTDDFLPYVKVSDVLDSTIKYNKKIEYILLPFTYVYAKEYVCNWWDYKNYNVILKRQDFNLNNRDIEQDEYYDNMLEKLRNIPQIIGEYRLVINALDEKNQKYIFVKNDTYYSNKKKDEERIASEINDLKEKINEYTNEYLYSKSLLFDYLKFYIMLIEKDVLSKYSEKSESFNLEEIGDKISSSQAMILEIIQSYNNSIDRVSKILQEIKYCNTLASKLDIDFKVSADFISITNDYKIIVDNLLNAKTKLDNLKENADSSLLKEDNGEYVIKSYNIIKNIYDNINSTYTFIFSLESFFSNILYKKIDEKVNTYIKEIELQIINKKIAKAQEEKIGFFDLLGKKKKIKQEKLKLFELYKNMVDQGLDGITKTSNELEKSYIKLEQILKYIDSSMNINVNSMLFFKNKIKSNAELDNQKIERCSGIYKNNILNPLPISKYTDSELFKYLKTQITNLNKELELSKGNKLTTSTNEKLKVDNMAIKINNVKTKLYDMRKDSLLVI